MSIIREDKLGLYVIHDSTIVRPFFGTKLEKGAKVKCQTRAQSPLVRVGGEWWGSSDIPSYAYQQKSFEPNRYSKLYGKNYETWDEYLRVSYEFHRKELLSTYGHSVTNQ